MAAVFAGKISPKRKALGLRPLLPRKTKRHPCDSAKSSMRDCKTLGRGRRPDTNHRGERDHEARYARLSDAVFCALDKDGLGDAVAAFGVGEQSAAGLPAHSALEESGFELVVPSDCDWSPVKLSCRDDKKLAPKTLIRTLGEVSADVAPCTTPKGFPNVATSLGGGVGA